MSTFRCSWLFSVVCAFCVPLHALAAEPAWLSALPKDWAPQVKTLCSLPAGAAGIEGFYVSDYAGFRKVLAIGTDGRYRFIEHREGDVRGHDIGTAHIDGDFVRLDPDKPSIQTPDGHLASEWHEYRLLRVDHAGVRLLMDEQDLDDIGAEIEWNGYLGRSDDFYRRLRCDETPLDSAGAEGPRAPPPSAFPPALRAWVFEKPVIATVTEVLPHTDSDEDDEIIVRIDKGKADRFRINMPLCSPTAMKDIHGWVADVDEHSSTLRVQLPTPMPHEPARFAPVGTKLSTRVGDCPKYVR